MVIINKNGNIEKINKNINMNDNIDLSEKLSLALLSRNGDTGGY